MSHLTHFLFLNESASEYLLNLSPVLTQWHTALEGSLGTDVVPVSADLRPRDTVAPVIVCPADTMLECAGSTLDFMVTALDNCDPNPVITCDWESGRGIPRRRKRLFRALR